MGKLEGVPATLAFHNGNEGKIIEIFLFDFETWKFGLLQQTL